MQPLAVSMGDPAGIGLELAARAWEARTSLPPFFVVGDKAALWRAATRIGVDVSECPVRETPLAAQEIAGTPNNANAPATIAAIEHGVSAIRAGEASALVTLPIAKHVLKSAGFGFPGHTEFVAHLTASDPWPHARGPVMLLAGPTLKVALVTIHTPLAQVPEKLTRDLIENTARVLGEALQRDFGIAAPRIALCGLNPHAGEDGTIGGEEIEIINPAAATLRAEGWNISDATSADALFNSEARQRYDAAIALYHDQGLIPIKTLHFWDAANITLGLPIIRTSPDHGTGFDIAGKGVARPDSFFAAMRMAWEMAERRAS